MIPVVGSTIEILLFTSSRIGGQRERLAIPVSRGKLGDSNTTLSGAVSAMPIPTINQQLFAQELWP